MAKYQLGIIYILRDEFQVFVPGLPSVLQFKFIPEIVRDLDIVNKELLYNVLKIFIINNNIPKTSFIIVIADSASIIKDFVSPTQPDQQPVQPEQLLKQADEFLEQIPFEEISSKSYPIDNGIRAYGTNKEMYESIKEAFLVEGFEILMVLPAIAMGPEVNTKASLEGDTINNILKNYPLVVKDYNLLKQPLQPAQSKDTSKETSEASETSKQEKKPDKKRVIILSAVFAVLIIVLIIVYFNQPKM